jgi:hypothetical protein
MSAFCGEMKSLILSGLLNSKSEILNPKQYLNSDVQNSKQLRIGLLLEKTSWFRALGFRSPAPGQYLPERLSFA